MFCQITNEECLATDSCQINIAVPNVERIKLYKQSGRCANRNDISTCLALPCVWQIIQHNNKYTVIYSQRQLLTISKACASFIFSKYF